MLLNPVQAQHFYDIICIANNLCGAVKFEFDGKTASTLLKSQTVTIKDARTGETEVFESQAAFYNKYVKSKNSSTGIQLKSNRL